MASTDTAAASTLGRLFWPPFLVAFTAWCLSNVDQSLFGYAVPAVMKDFAIGLDAISFMISGAFAFGIVVSIAVGVLSDTWGARRTLPLCLGISALCIGLQAYRAGRGHLHRAADRRLRLLRRPVPDHHRHGGQRLAAALAGAEPGRAVLRLSARLVHRLAVRLADQRGLWLARHLPRRIRGPAPGAGHVFHHPAFAPAGEDRGPGRQARRRPCAP